MESVTDDRYLWSRVLLGLMALGFALLAGLGLLGSMMAMGPENEIPREWILAPALVALIGMVLAGLGGLPAGIASGVLGLVTLAGGSMFLAQRPPQDWLQSRFDVGLAAMLGAAIALGLAAVIVAIRVSMQPRLGGTPS